MKRLLFLTALLGMTLLMAATANAAIFHVYPADADLCQDCKEGRQQDEIKYDRVHRGKARGRVPAGAPCAPVMKWDSNWGTWVVTYPSQETEECYPGYSSTPDPVGNRPGINPTSNPGNPASNSGSREHVKPLKLR